MIDYTITQYIGELINEIEELRDKNGRLENEVTQHKNIVKEQYLHIGTLKEALQECRK